MVVRELRQYVARSGNPSRTTPRESAPTIRLRPTSRPTGWPNAHRRPHRRRPSAVPGRRRAAAGPLQSARRTPSASCRDRSARPWLPGRRACPPCQSARRPGQDLASAQTLLDAANNHRILRRGRKYGPPPADRHTDDGAERGLLFICLNADIARQFEFVQQTWILNRNFATLYDETDPLVGPKGGFTIGEQAVAPDRRCRDLHPDRPEASISSCRAFPP